MNSLEAKISREIHRFDLISLIFLLYKLGYSQDQIFFVSHYDISSQPSLMRKIQFHESPQRQVTVFVNVGLMSVQTPVPSYFFRQLDRGLVDADTFGEFVAFFDQLLLREFVLAIYPEINPKLFQDWELAKRHFVGNLNLRSCSTLHWLFGVVFPELEVQVEKALLGRSMETRDIVLGLSRLDGNCVFGKRTSTPVQGLRVALIADDEKTSLEVPWPREIHDRMEAMIFPLLKSVGMDLEVFLIIRLQTSWARLDVESFLGYDRIKGGSEQQRRIPIYLGYLVE